MNNEPIAVYVAASTLSLQIFSITDKYVQVKWSNENIMHKVKTRIDSHGEPYFILRNHKHLISEFIKV